MSERLEYPRGGTPMEDVFNRLADVINAMAERLDAVEHAFAHIIVQLEAVSEVVARHHGDELLGELRLVEQPETPIGPFLVCPACGEMHDMHRAISAPGSRPKPGDVMVCIKCAAIIVFDHLENDNATGRLPDTDELETLKSVPEIRALVKAVRDMRAERN
jgi:hypothetical protein